MIPTPELAGETLRQISGLLIPRRGGGVPFVDCTPICQEVLKLVRPQSAIQLIQCQVNDVSGGHLPFLPHRIVIVQPIDISHDPPLSKKAFGVIVVVSEGRDIRPYLDL